MPVGKGEHWSGLTSAPARRTSYMALAIWMQPLRELKNVLEEMGFPGHPFSKAKRGK